jgi:transposase, IS30 family
MKEKKYKHLNQSDRDRIEILLREGYEQKEIAKVLGVHKSTVSREVKKHQRKDGGYEANTAEQKAYVKRLQSKYQGMKVESLPEVKKEIIQALKEKRSPDEIAGRMSLEKGETVIGKDAIYRWLYSAWGGQYCKLLCTKRYKPKKQKKEVKREMIPNRVPLGERPKRGIHWQGDLFVSPQKLQTTESVAILCDEESQYLAGTKIKNRKPKTMVQAVSRLLSFINADTLTWDNGIENKDHQDLSVPSYFCEPYSPWQKPHVECNIGLLRRWFFKKGTDLRKVPETRLQEAITTINQKYRKSLGYKNALEVALERGSIKRKSLKDRLLNNLSRLIALEVRI